MKRLGLDWGTVRVGYACSDETGSLAFARGHFLRRSKDRDLAAIRQAIEDEGGEVGEIVVGLPCNADGSEGPSAASARHLAGRIEAALGLDVVLWDERYSSAEARERLRETGLSERAIRGLVDAEAARIILQSYLDQLRQAEIAGEQAPAMEPG